MPKIEIIAAGKLKSGPVHELCAEYLKRLHWPVSIREIHTKGDENREIEKHIDAASGLVVLDEKGKSLSSAELAAWLEKTGSHKDKVQFIIGGADGLSDSIRQKAGLVLSFGKQTWPHMLARAMLLEQIYRAQQILSGHPYHRE